MAIRLSGMNSGMDTDALVEALVSAKSEKKKTLEKAQKKHEWTQDAWKTLNSKIYNFYSKTLSNTRFKTDYLKKATTSSSSAVSVVTGSKAPNCVQEMKVISLSKAGYHTGAQLTTTGEDGKSSKASYSTSTKLSELGISFGTTTSVDDEGNEIEASEKRMFTITSGGEAKEIEISGDMTIAEFTSKLSGAGVTANFDEKNQRFYISASGNGVDSDFSYGDDATTNEVLNSMGLGRTAVTDDNPDGFMGVRLMGADAEIELNGERYTSTTNSFEINGLSITVKNTTDETITLTTAQDTKGMYDTVKKMIKEYNELINEMDKLYTAPSARKYSMLSKEEKEEMSDDEIKDWEDKIKSALLRGDSTLNNVASAMKSIMSQGVKMSDGRQMYLSDFGIATAGYFSSAENEKNAYHIDGDPDDATSAGKEDKLSAMIAEDPEQVADFFSSLSKTLYTKLDELMGRTEYSSAFTVYNDKLMKTQYTDYTTKITKQEEMVTKWEDYYYKKFTAMETAMASLQEKQSAISGLIGS
ncbi:MAG: flagellar filament capping protein FliD [Lachnospiraceae bacterium]|nr:flagellar filament capping protein FliD [Candidatus Colinaster scatohippi]